MGCQRDCRALAESLLDGCDSLRRVGLVLRTFGIVWVLDMGELLIAEVTYQEGVDSEFSELSLFG